MYGDSHALSSDSGPIYSPNPKPEEHLAASPNNPELWFLFMESDTNSNYSEYRPQFSSSNSSQINSAMLKYRSSAPSFLLESFTNNGVREKCTGRLSSRFCFDDENSRMNDVCSNNGSSGIGALLPPQYPSQNVGRLGSLAVDGGGFSAVAVSSMGMENQVLQEKMGPNVLRQNSTPAGFFSNLTPEHAYGSIRSGTGSYKIPDCGDNNGDLSPCSSRQKNRNIFFSGTLSQISEVENRPDDAKAGSGSDHDSLFGFPFGSWNDSSNFAENFSTGIKSELDDDPHKLFGDTLNKEPGNRSNTLSRHLSLPKTSSEMEKLLQHQDMVPCKIRAKRGCATHPRSIAERLRRTRISERMRKLQELVPNMDKQTNTADMLDMAVEYIKNLQEQYKALCEHRANCKCSTSHKMVQNQRP